jgi:predicted porin
MAEVGIKYQSGQFFGGLQYNHLFAMHSAPSAFLENEDIGLIEAHVGYQINENVAATLSVETQVVGDSALEKDLGIALGLLYSF